MENLNTTKFQLKCFNNIISIIGNLPKNIQISQATDGEICINKISESGIKKIIIHDCESIAISYISKNDSSDYLKFYNEADINYETLVSDFFN